jgi:Reverse transcriptase (RNA-dependent DNA polymerase)
MILVLKAGKDPRAAASYGPISLTSTLCKLMERLVVNRLQWYLERHGLLSKVQSGLRRNRDTLDLIVRLQDTIVRQVHYHGCVLAVFLDMESAFDMVWRKGLMIKLKRFGINGRMFDWIESFVKDWTFHVRVYTTLSGDLRSENGRAQGAMLSPLAFLNMIDDLPSVMDDVETSLYADHSMLYKTGKNIKHLVRSMQRALDKAVAWAEEWGFKISTEKSVTVLFSPINGSKLDDVKLTIGIEPVKVEKTAKFLGAFFR